MFKTKPIRPDVGAIDTLIGPQVTIRGDVVFSGGLYVEGHIQGKVIAEAGERAVLTLARTPPIGANSAYSYSARTNTLGRMATSMPRPVVNPAV